MTLPVSSVSRMADLAEDISARQRQAAHPLESVWVAASAGSGKTKVLTDRVLRLLLGQLDQPAPNPARILCLTFTKAAASEMALRVTDKCRDWAVWPEERLDAALQDLFGHDLPKPRDMPALRQRARQCFARLLDLPDGLKIQTLHGFCTGLLRRFPLEAGISPQFATLEESESRALQAECLATILRNDSADPTLAAKLDFLATQVERGELMKIMTAILAQRERLQDWLNELDQPDPEPALRASLGLDSDEDATTILANGCAEGAFHRADLNALLQAVLAHGTEKEQEKFSAVAAWLAGSDVDRVADFESYRTAFLTQSRTIDKRYPTSAVKKKFPRAAEIYQREAERLQAVLELRNRAFRAEVTTALLAVAIPVLQRYEAIKHHRSLYDFNDLIRLAVGLLERDGVAAWVLYRLDGGLDHVLIDEAQDTNPEQWRIVEALTAEFTSGRGAHEDKSIMPRTLFVVGDEKQSIFSFQGADRNSFITRKDFFRQRFENARLVWREIPLNTSFRSAPAILKAVDAVFAHPEAHDGVSETPTRHFAFRRNQGGIAEIWPIVSSFDDKDKAANDIPVERLAQKIALTLRDWFEKGTLLPGRGRPIRPDDVMILLRSRGNIALAILRACKFYGVPIAGLDRMNAADSLAIQDCLAFARFLLLPDDDLTLASLLRSPLLEMSEEDLFRLCHERRPGETVWQALRRQSSTTRPDWQASVAWLLDWLNRFGRMAPFEIFAILLATSCPADSGKGGSARRALLRRLGHEAMDSLDALLNDTLAHSTNALPSLQDFIHQAAIRLEDIKRSPGSANSGLVRMMTVHGSKGLQAPIVILADAFGIPQAGKDKGLLWDEANLRAPPLWPVDSTRRDGETARRLGLRREKNLQEYRRLLYVALTRAEDHLIVTGSEGRKKAKSAKDSGKDSSSSPQSWYDLVQKGWAEIMPDSGTEWGDGWSGQARLYQEATTVNLHSVTPQISPTPETALPDWIYTPAPAELTPARPLSATRLAGEDEEQAAASPLANTIETTRRRFGRGVMIHSLLQFLPNLPLAQREKAAKRFVRQKGAEWDTAQQDDIVTTTLATLHHPDWAEIFSQNSHAELPIVGRVGDVMVAGRVDRAVFTRDEILLIDYKTNRPPPATKEGVAPAYIRQMQAYRDVLAQIYPDKTIRCALLWTDGPNLMEI